MKNRKNNNTLKIFRKNKYNLILIIIFLVIGLILFSKLINFIANRNLVKYDNEIISLKNNDSEIDSLSLKNIRKMDTSNVKISLDNGQEFKVEGVSIEKILNKEGIDANLSSRIEFVDTNGKKTNMSLDKALEVDRVFLVYKIDSKPNIESNRKLGTFFILDRQEKDSNNWIKNIQIINIK